MKKKLVILVLSFVMVLAFANLNVSARTVITNLCEKDDIVVTWSGTWQQAGTEGTNNPGTNLVDGDYYNKWGSNDIRSTKEEWVQITFTQPEIIHGFCIYQESSGAYTNIQQYTLQVQNGTEEWVTVYTSPLFEELWLEDAADFEEPVTATAIRFHCTDEQAAAGTHTPSGQCAVELSEIELFQKTEVEDTPTPEPTNTPKPTNTPNVTDKPGSSSGDTDSPLPVILAVAGGILVVAIIAIAVIRVKKSKA